MFVETSFDQLEQHLRFMANSNQLAFTVLNFRNSSGLFVFCVKFLLCKIVFNRLMATAGQLGQNHVMNQTHKHIILMELQLTMRLCVIKLQDLVTTDGKLYCW